MEWLAKVVKKLGSIDFRWFREVLTGKEYALTHEDQQRLLGVLKKSNYIILTKRRWTVSSWFILLASFILTRRKVYWTHALMNVEGDGAIQLMEAIGKGVVVSDFFSVFNCDAVTVLRPRMPQSFPYEMQWETIVEAAYSYMGKEYDTLSDLLDDNKMNCTEFVWKCLQGIKDSDVWFHGLKALIERDGNLCPQMFYDCGSFQVVFEVRR